MKWLITNKIEEVTKDWDTLVGENIFLRRIFLKHLQKVNPCRQSYNSLYVNNELKAIYVDYKANLDIFTYSLLKLKHPVTIMGIPCSVSKQGFRVSSGYEEILVNHFWAKKGAKLILNSEQELTINKGTTLPTSKLKIEWGSFTDYVLNMRSHYRYRIKKALERWSPVQVEIINPQQFDGRLYRYYEEVYANSQAKLEKLNHNFFREIPLSTVVIKASYQNEGLGFVYLIENKQELIFLFTGFNPRLNKNYDIYFNLLLEIVGYGIANNFKTVDFGQTAEETKLKLGCRLHEKSMYINHSNPLLNKWVNNNIKILSYSPPSYDFRVFKNNREGSDYEDITC